MSADLPRIDDGAGDPFEATLRFLDWFAKAAPLTCNRANLPDGLTEGLDSADAEALEEDCRRLCQEGLLRRVYVPVVEQGRAEAFCLPICLKKARAGLKPLFATFGEERHGMLRRCVRNLMGYSEDAAPAISVEEVSCATVMGDSWNLGYLCAALWQKGLLKSPYKILVVSAALDSNLKLVPVEGLDAKYGAALKRFGTDCCFACCGELSFGGPHQVLRLQAGMTAQAALLRIAGCFGLDMRTKEVFRQVCGHLPDPDVGKYADAPTDIATAHTSRVAMSPEDALLIRRAAELFGDLKAHWTEPESLLATLAEGRDVALLRERLYALGLWEDVSGGWAFRLMADPPKEAPATADEADGIPWVRFYVALLEGLLAGTTSDTQVLDAVAARIGRKDVVNGYWQPLHLELSLPFCWERLGVWKESLFNLVFRLVLPLVLCIRTARQVTAKALRQRLGLAFATRLMPEAMSEEVAFCAIMDPCGNGLYRTAIRFPDVGMRRQVRLTAGLWGWWTRALAEDLSDACRTETARALNEACMEASRVLNKTDFRALFADLRRPLPLPDRAVVLAAEADLNRLTDVLQAAVIADLALRSGEGASPDTAGTAKGVLDAFAEMVEGKGSVRLLPATFPRYVAEWILLTDLYARALGLLGDEAAAQWRACRDALVTLHAQEDRFNRSDRTLTPEELLKFGQGFAPCFDRLVKEAGR